MIKSLVKKDLLLIRRYIWLLLAFDIVIPVSFSNTPYVGPLGFFIITSVTSYIILITSGTKEMQYPKAASLLCAAPYSRRQMVLSKYVIVFAAYVFCCLVFEAESLIWPRIGGLSVRQAAQGFLILALVVGISMPLQFRYGFEKIRYLMFVVYFVSYCVLPMAARGELGAAIEKAARLPFVRFIAETAGRIAGAGPVAAVLGILVLSFLILTVSVTLSMRIYDRLDLA